MKIKIDDLTGEQIAAFLEEHMHEMRETSPPESTHALDLSGLRTPGVTFWVVWDKQTIAGCGALKQLDEHHAEIKSMRTSTAYKQRGVASMLLQHIIIEAKSRGYQQISLETGSMHFFEPARKLYSKYGFEFCQPFNEYIEDPNSVFMTKLL